jgi:uncharacterized membrane protein YphA (DoxX/SURF4 family)
MRDGDMKLHSRFRLVVRLILAAIFAIAAIDKMSDADSRKSAPTVYSELFSSAVVPSAVISAEIFLAVWLMSGLGEKGAAAIAIVILSVFAGVVLLELTKDNPKPCGCLGAPKHLSDVSAIRRSLQIDLIRNLIMMVAASLLYLLPRAPKHSSEYKSNPTICTDLPDGRCQGVV